MSMITNVPIQRRKFSDTLLSGVAIVLMAAPAASGQDFGDTAIPEIVVTARKREENIMRVPDAITAFTAEQIDDRRFAQIDDFLAVTPNVHIVNDQDAGTSIISMRGIGSNRNEAAAVAFVVDGVILPDSDAFTTDLSDAERVELLKGPQGALYGKGAIAGVINIATRQPTTTPSFDAKLSYGTGDAFTAYGAAAGPLSEDKLLARVSVKYKKTDGVLINRFNNQGVDRDEYVKPSVKLVAMPTDNLNVEVNGSYYDQKGGASAFSTINVLGTTGGRANDVIARTQPDQDSPNYNKRKIYDASLIGNLDTDFGQWTSITAYDKIDVDFLEDLDFTRFNVSPDAHQTRKTRGWSQELRLTSPSDQSFRYIAGAYYQNTKRAVRTTGKLDFCFVGVPLPFCTTPPLVSSGIIVPLNFNSVDVKADQYSGFGQANVDVTEKLELTLALRYSRDSRDQTDMLTGRQASANFGDWQPKASLAYKPSEDVMVYGTYSHGYKSGTFNPPPTAGAAYPAVVKQESTDNFEFGVKSSFANRSVLVSASAFSTRYQNPQIFQLDVQSGGQVTINAKRARLTGFETELLARPVHGLEINASLGYTDSEIKDFDGTARFRGQRLPNSPKYSLNLGMQYAHDVAGDMTLTGRVDYARQGLTSFQDFQNPNTNQFIYQPSYGTVDAQLSLTNGSWTLTGYGKNILGNHYIVSAYSRYIAALILAPLNVDVVQTAPGATFGAELRVSF